jgi:hypothetical protein
VPFVACHTNTQQKQQNNPTNKQQGQSSSPLQCAQLNTKDQTKTHATRPKTSQRAFHLLLYIASTSHNHHHHHAATDILAGTT